MLEYKPGETPGARYNRLAWHVRSLDPSFVPGVASVPEIDRVERALAELERKAAEKKVKDASNDPLGIARAGIFTLWSRGLKARESIRKMQEEKLGRKYSSSDSIHWHPELLALKPPAEFFEPVPDIGLGEPPRFSALAEADTIAAGLSVTVAKLEALASEMKYFVNGWENLSFEQQTRRLVMTLFERQQFPSDSWGPGE